MMKVTNNEKMLDDEYSVKVGDVVEIQDGDYLVWAECEKFVGQPSVVMAVFKTGDLTMIAVEHVEDRVCACFRADMAKLVRTAEPVDHYDQAPDWSKAPEGTTHWAAETDDTYAVWYREKNGGWECWVHPDGCSWSRVSSDYLPNLIPRPDPDWIPTNGKKPDLPDDTLLDVKFTNGAVDIRSRADIWIWSQVGESYDITHYRIHRGEADASTQ